MKTNIALIGFMGTGKTAVGKTLARKLGKEFIELDHLIERRAGKAITEIFRQDGEIAFRELEIEVTKGVSTKKNVVIACGGGVVLNRINIDRLRRESAIVYLTASPKVILKRTSVNEGERPLLQVANPTLAVQGLLRFRQPFYERAADILINTSRSDINSIVRQIIGELEEHEGFSL